MVLTTEEIEGYKEASKAWKARILSMEYLHNLRNEILALEESQCRESHQLVVDVIKYCLLCMWLRDKRLITKEFHEYDPVDSVVQRYKLYRYSYVAPLFPKKSPQSLNDFASVYQCGIVLTGDNLQPGHHTRRHSSPPPCDSRSIASLGKELPTVFNDDPINDEWIAFMERCPPDHIPPFLEIQLGQVDESESHPIEKINELF